MTVSVVIPTRDRGALLAEAVESALAIAVSEVVVVDAGSTDGSIEALPDPVRVVRLGPANAARARNAGAAASSGDYLAFLDSDDVMLPAKATALAPLLARDATIVLAHGRTVVIDRSGLETPERTLAHERQLADAKRRGTTYAALAGYCALYTSATLVRRSAFEAVGGYDETIDVFEDWDLYLRLALQGQIVYAPEVTARYRVWPGNVAWERTAAGIVQVAEKHLGSPPDLPPAELAEARYAFLQRLAEANHVLVRPRETRRAAAAALRQAPGRAIRDSSVRSPFLRSFVPAPVLRRRRPTR